MKRLLSIVCYSLFSSLFLLLCCCFSVVLSVSAQTATSCVVTKVGNPSGTPPVCAGESSGAPPGSFVYYCQGDPRWGNTCDIKNAGCGPTSTAMIISTLSTLKTPDQVDKLFQSTTPPGRTCSDEGSTISPNVIQSKWFRDLGLQASDDIASLLNDSSQWNKVKEFFTSGHLILASSDTYPCPCGNPDSPRSSWISASHIVAIQDIDPANGTVAVRDPSNCYYGDGNGHKAGDEGVQNINVPIKNVSWKWAFPIKKV